VQRVTCHESGVWAAHIAGVALDTLSVNANNNSNSCKTFAAGQGLLLQVDGRRLPSAHERTSYTLTRSCEQCHRRHLLDSASVHTGTVACACVRVHECAACVDM
jgi:hypothetical protein